MDRPDRATLWRLPPVPSPAPVPSRWPWLDVIVVALLMLGLIGTNDSVLLVLNVVLLLPLLGVRRWPVACSLLTIALSLVQLVVIDHPIWAQLGVPLTAYAAARYAPPVWAWCILLAGFAGAVLSSVDWMTGWVTGFRWDQLLAYVVFESLIVMTGWVIGALNRIRSAYVESLLERGRHLEHEARQQAELAAMDERARIARELHDVVAHGLSVMIVQADGARYAAAGDPQAVLPALETISETGRSSLAEMRQMLGLLREEEEAETRPLPSLAELPWLLGQAEAAGTRIEQRLPDPMPQVPPTTGLVVYRLVQEALTNVRKHAGPAARVDVRLDHEPGRLSVTVADDGRGASAVDDGSGMGLLGMRERVAAVGGTVETGPRPGGGFLVSAWIPLD